MFKAWVTITGCIAGFVPLLLLLNEARKERVEDLLDTEVGYML